MIKKSKYFQNDDAEWFRSNLKSDNELYYGKFVVLGKSFLNPSRYAVIPEYLSEKIVFQLLTDFWLENLPNGVISVVNSDTSCGNTGKISEIFDFAARGKCAIFTNGGSKIARKFGEKRQNLHETVTHSLIGFIDQKIIKFGEKYSCSSDGLLINPQAVGMEFD